LVLDKDNYKKLSGVDLSIKILLEISDQIAKLIVSIECNLLTEDDKAGVHHFIGLHRTKYIL
jgi:hypothetical protein